MEAPRVWLITGASTGFGRSLSEFVLSRGDIVVATLRKPEVLQELSASHSKEKLLVLKLDVTDQADIDHAFARAKEVYGRLDVVFNNAGIPMVGDAETTPIDKARTLFDVNFWGAVNVSRVAVKFFREVNVPGRGGVLLQNSSISGKVGGPGQALYGASKHALEGFSESLASEVLPEWNIKICIISAGFFQTNAMHNAIFQPLNTVYNKEGTTLWNVWQVISSGKLSELGGDPAKFAKAIYGLVEGGRIPLHLVIGKDALALAKSKMEALSKDISEAELWSADLLRDNVDADKIAEIYHLNS